MTLDETMVALEAAGSPTIKAIHRKHGATEPLFGVKVADLKLIAKRTGIDHALAKALFAGGNYDARYLANYVVDDAKTTKAELNAWVKSATAPMLSEYAVPWCAAASRFGTVVAAAWIDTPKAHIVAAGWCTYAALVAVTADEELDATAYAELLQRVGNELRAQPDRVRSAMNRFVIAVGAYCVPLSAAANRTAESIGTVVVDNGDTACKTPNAVEAIGKAIARGSLTKKRKTARC